MRIVKLAATVACLGLASVPAQAAPWDGMGPMMAQFYNEAMSIPKGWSMSYAGREGGIDVFVVDSDFDTHPMTSFMRADDQLRRLVCGDATMKQWMAQGLRVRADQRSLRGGKKSLTRGSVITAC